MLNWDDFHVKEVYSENLIGLVRFGCDMCVTLVTIYEGDVMF